MSTDLWSLFVRPTLVFFYSHKIDLLMICYICCGVCDYDFCPQLTLHAVDNSVANL